MTQIKPGHRTSINITYSRAELHAAPSAVETTGRVRHEWSQGSLSSVRLVKSTSTYIKRSTADSKLSVARISVERNVTRYFCPTKYCTACTIMPNIVLQLSAMHSSRLQDLVENWVTDMFINSIRIISELYLITILIIMQLHQSELANGKCK